MTNEIKKESYGLETSTSLNERVFGDSCSNNIIYKIIKVLDLFAGTQSVRKALELWKQWYEKTFNFIVIFEYIGIDIYSPEGQNTILDLTQDDIVNKLIEVLPQGWKPDFIWASPVCNKFSTACAYKGGNLFFEVENNDIKVRTKMDDPNNKVYCDVSKLPRYQQEAKFALLLHRNTKAIIDYFGSKFVIENPRRALSRYLYKDYYHNYTSYCMYGFEYQKPTTIYSNVKLELKTCNHTERHRIMLSGNKNDYVNGVKNLNKYADRARVPELLIVDIFNQLFNKEQNNENNK